ncbi:MAG: hypothetical protein WCR66_07675 [Bacteroidota bacterium]
MKKIICLLIFMSSFFMSIAQKSKKNTMDGSALTIGVSYSMPTRMEFEKYFAVVGDSLHLTSSIIPQKTYGLSLAYSILNDKWEFEMGGGLSSGIKVSSSNALNTNSASLSTSTIDIHFGLAKYILGPLFIGFDLAAISNAGKFVVNENTGTLFEDSPESHNPFKGYAFSVRPKAGFFIPFRAGTYSGIKLNAFYDYGISKYEFYKNDIFQSRLKNYAGATKSSFNGFGAQVVLVFGM